VKDVNFHIAFLLTSHECVVIPDFGAFVVSHFDHEKENKWGLIYPPLSFLSFNPEIRHNDGLLVNSLVAEKNISYAEAATQVSDYVKSLNKWLDDGQIFTIPFVGSLTLSIERKIIFKPATNLSCNASMFGFANFTFAKLRDATDRPQQVFLPTRKPRPAQKRNFAAYGTAAAAAALALFLVSTPLNDYPVSSSIRSASFIPAVKQEMPAETVADEVVAEAGKSPVETLAETIAETPSANSPQPVSVSPADKGNYFIVIASFATRKSAEKAALALASPKINQPLVLETENRFLIYTDSFNSAEEGEKYLRTFRKNNKKHADAWLYRCRKRI
jgi:hypothetical protein